MAIASAGMVVTRAPRPAAATRAINPIPSAVPRMCLTVRPNPNSAPDAQRSTLFGPGVTELTNEKATRATNVSMPGMSSALAAHPEHVQDREHEEDRESEGRADHPTHEPGRSVSDQGDERLREPEPACPAGRVEQVRPPSEVAEQEGPGDSRRHADGGVGDD